MAADPAKDSADTHSNGDRPQVLLVVGAPWIGVARLPRILKDAGCRVVLLCHRGRFATRSRFVDEWIDAPADVAELVPVLKRLIEDRPFRWVILGDDLTLRAAVRDAGPWRKGWFPVDPNGDAASLLVSKTAFAWAMERSGIPFPATEVASGAEVPMAARRIGFPVMIKSDESSSGDGITWAGNPKALAGFDANGPMVVQRFAPGRVGSTAILYSAGRPLCWMSSYKEEVYPRPYGPSTVRRYVHLPGIEPHLERLGAILGMTGLCGIDWVQPPGAEEPVFLELNGRPTAWIHLHRNYGVDFPRAIRAMLRGTPQVIRPPEVVPEPVVRMFPQDAYRAASERDWPGFVRGLGNREDAPQDEPGLLQALQRYLLKRAWQTFTNGPPARA